MARLVEDLLDVSRITRGTIVLRKELLALRDVVERAVESVRPLVEAQGHTLHTVLPVEKLLVEADPTRLEQVLVNLLTNAAKYSDRDGTITITATAQPGKAVLSVRDTGIGMEPELLPHIFELFVQEKQALDRAQGGLGIGLTLVKGLVEGHGGEIRAHSDGPGQGSEFVITLPMAPNRAAGPNAHRGPAPGRIRARVLVVEDNVDAAETLTELLELVGHEVCHAANGPEALEQARSFHPDVALVDIGLPGMDGYEVARRLRAQPSERPLLLVALTGYGQDDDLQRSRAAGFDRHLVKPIDFEVLQGLLAEAPRRRVFSCS
jgi:two-component system CheB/CheR fusion protein